MRTFSLAALLSLATGTALGIPPVGEGVPPMLAREPNRDASPFFVRDAKKPNHLHQTDRARLEGLDRDYVEAMVRPPIDPAVLDEIERIKGKRSSRIEAPQGVPSPLLATRSGNVIVIQGSNLTVNTQNGTAFDHNNGFIDVANLVLSQYGDNFDFISVWTTFPDQNVAAYYYPLKQDTENLGDCNFNTGETFGCVFDQTGGQLERLQGLVFMNSVSTWQQWDRYFDGVVHPLDSFDSACYSTLGQEIAHRWGSGLRFVDRRTGNISKKMLGRDNSHWAAWLDTNASVMDGWDWQQTGEGRFVVTNEMDRYSQLDLYTIGALAPNRVEDFFWIEDARYEANGLNIDGDLIGNDDVLGLGLPSVAMLEDEWGVELGATGTRVDVRMQDVLDAEGMRCPDSDHAPRAFRQAFVLITGPNETENQALDDAADLEIVEQTWEAWWHDRTDRAVTLCSSLDGDCDHAILKLEVEDDVKVDLGASGKTLLTVIAEEATVKNAQLKVSLSGQGADNVKLKKDTFSLGEIPVGQNREVELEFELGEDTDCGLSFVIDTEVSSENARTERQSVRVLPGFKFLKTSGFADGADDFEVNADGKDTADAESGALEWREVQTSCSMSARAPERDNSADNSAAFVTATRLDGDTTLWSPKLDLEGAVDPEVRFSYWLDGEGGSLTAQLSRDGGDSFRDGKVYDIPGHSWAQGALNVRDIFDGEVPEEIVVRFLFVGNGDTEGGIDDFRAVDVEGVCLQRSNYACGCDVSGSAAPQSTLAVLFALLGLRVGGRKLGRRRA
jgi:hypothetical protein